MEIDKNLKQKAGIYKFTNTINLIVYIGSTCDLFIRLNDGHLRSLRLNEHYNQKFQRSWNKHGEENFIVEVVEYVEIIDDLEFFNEYLLSREQHYLDTLLFAQEYIITKPLGKDRDKRFDKLGFNLTPTADRTYGWSPNTEQLAYNSMKMTELWATEEYRINVMKNRKYESYSHKETTKQKISEAHKERFENNPELKKIHGDILNSPENKEKQKIAHELYWSDPKNKEKFYTEEFREEKRQMNLRLWKTDEYREKRIKTYRATLDDPNYIHPLYKRIEVTFPDQTTLLFNSKKECQKWIKETFGTCPDITGDYILKSRPYKDHMFRYV